MVTFVEMRIIPQVLWIQSR